ncbi:ATP synthase F1 subunit delta [Flexithrix dorotheae]|uniref:ATP synthase F1 subunit delta n=1 Tax=Flexithrix dorotheae TaxID=70993 RepID=UPI000366CEC8|nr:ATP synthase F1 subunit delta [Flexithrix dorotheae]
MSADTRVATRYARSLILLSEEKNELEKVMADMSLVDATCDESRELRVLLKNPIIKGDKKYRILKQIFEKGISRTSLVFLKIVARKNRLNALHEIASEVVRQYNERKGIQQAIVKTAIPLNDKLKAEFSRIVKEVSGKEPMLIEKVDKNLVGGFVLTVGDKQIDDSIATKLKTLKFKFSA